MTLYLTQEEVKDCCVDFVTTHWLYDVLLLLMATGQDSQHDFAPAWLKLPSQDALKPSRFGGHSFEHSAGDRSGHTGWYNGISGTRGAMEELSAYTRYPRRQRFYSTDYQPDYAGNFNANFSADGQRHYVRYGTRPVRHHDQLNGSLSDPYHVNGVRSPISSVSLPSKKLHQHADGHMGGVATEFSKTTGKKSDGNRNGKNAVVSLEDDFPSLNGDMRADKPLFSKVLSVWDSPGRDPNVISTSSQRSQSAMGGIDTGHKALVLKTGSAKRLGSDAGTSAVSSNGPKQTSGPAVRDSTQAGSQAASEVLGACLVTQPRKLADKKSSFLRALRRESSETNADATPTSPVSPSPTLTTENRDKQYAADACSDEASSVSRENPGEPESEISVDDSSLAEEVFPSEAEERLLRAMGWTEMDDDDNGYEITEDDVREFEDLCRQMKLNKVNEEPLRNGFATDLQAKLKSNIIGVGMTPCVSDISAPYVDPASDELSDTSDESDINVR